MGQPRIMPQRAAARALGGERGKQPAAFLQGDQPPVRQALGGVEAAVAIRGAKVVEAEGGGQGESAVGAMAGRRHQDGERLDQRGRDPKQG